MANLFELKQQREAALQKAEALIAVAERGGRVMTAQESKDCDAAMAEVNALNPQIERIERKNTMRSQFPNGRVLTDGAPSGMERIKPRAFSPEYRAELFTYIQSNGRTVGPHLSEFVDASGGYPLAIQAALYEGSNTAGGYAVPVTTDPQIVPLAPQELAVRNLATVIPTTNDIKMPQKASFGTASAKAETSAFGNSELTLSQFTLSAFMCGNVEEISWELAQDVPAFQATTVDDLVIGIQMLEENWFVNGTGTGQAQGLIGNVGAGVTEEADTNGNLVTVNGTLDLLAKLNAVYHPGASWLMSRPTSIVIRKAQVESNLFNPVWTRVGSQDFLHGYPVYYSASMPSAARGNTPVLFGDFKRAYIIGDRGGSGINVKILDQPKATLGILQLLGYRRTDGRVRRSEAVQSYVVAAS